MKKLFFFLLLPLLVITSGCHQRSATYLGYIDGDYVYLSSSVSGRLSKCLVKRGDPVKSGQVLYQLDNNPEQSQLNQSLAKLEEAKQQLANLVQGQRNTIVEAIVAQQQQAQAQLVLAKNDLDRYARLYKEGAVGKADYDSRLATFKSANQSVKQYDANLAEAKLGARQYLIAAQIAEVDAAKAAVASAQWSLAQKTMLAPKAGLIFDTFYREGEFVPAGGAVLALLPPQNIEVKFYVPEADLGQLKIGDQIEFRCDQCSHKGTGTIYYLSSQAEYTPPIIYSKDSREQLIYRIQARIPPKEALLFHTGQPVEIQLTH